MLNPPKAPISLRHVALFVKDFNACAHFYTKVLHMKIVWQPDPDNLYLSSGTDNLALHRAPKDFSPHEHQHLDHIGFFLTTENAVDEWYDYLTANQVKIIAQPKKHRDGTRSFYCADPDGNVVQMIYYPLEQSRP